jgi:hypothetical protein
LEKVKCKKFISYFQENYSEVYSTSSKYSKEEILSVVSLFSYSSLFALCSYRLVTVRKTASNRARPERSTGLCCSIL